VAKAARYKLKHPATKKKAETSALATAAALMAYENAPYRKAA